MKKIINGKRYDTATAHEVYVASNGYARNDFAYVEETLYRKTTGEYFLYGEGGPMSRYAETIGQNEWQGGAEIIPLSLQAAKQWAEENMDGDDYEKEFGVVDESGEKCSMTISVTAGTRDKMKKAALEKGISVSAMIEQLMEKV